MTEENHKQLEKIENKKTEESNKAQVNPFTPDATGDLPPEVVKEVRSFMSMSMGRMPHPIVEKLTPQHIDTILQSAEKDDERTYKDIGRSRWFTFAYVVMGLVVFLFLTVFFAGSDKELYKEMLKLGIVAAGGFGSGFGFKTYLDKKQ